MQKNMKKLIILMIGVVFHLIATAHGGSNYENSDFFKEMKEGDKAAIVMVHFGTTHDDTREKTIDQLNTKVKETFPQADVFEAYTSRIIIKRLKDREISKETPLELLNNLADQGYTHILIQSSNIINGVEVESLNKDIAHLKKNFKDVRIGNPLLYTPEDYKYVIDILTKNNDPQTAYVWVGHGTYDSTTAQYAMLDYMLKAEEHDNCFVGTIEGYPTYENMLAQLKKSGLKKVVLVPFMFVAGEHAKNDIAGDWKAELEKEGFEVTVDPTGLGENTEIQNIYLDHLKFISKHKEIGIMKKKSIYEKTGEKN